MGKKRPPAKTTKPLRKEKAKRTRRGGVTVITVTVTVSPLKPDGAAVTAVTVTVL